MTNKNNKEDITNNKIQKRASEILADKDNIFAFFLEHSLSKKSYNFYIIIIFINLISLLVKFSIGLYGFSGENHSPKFGDYEAQRHWMELTNNVKIENWYTNSDENPNKYWPLDYPPMSGYHAFFAGKFMKFFLPESISLVKSWGYESLKHKILMRLTVILSDLLLFHIPIFFLLNKVFLRSKDLSSKNQLPIKNIKRFLLTYLLILLSPCLNIIDHGHFQYNCVMHGLFYFAVFFLLRRNFIITIVLYSLSINFKQMGMYFSLTFLGYVLNKTFHYNPNKINNSTLNEKKDSFSFIAKLFYILKKIIIYGIATITINCIIWLPWIRTHKVHDVVSRIFPLWRGIFEDKVATFWCNLNIIYKLQNIPNNYLLIASVSLTLFASLFSLFALVTYKKKTQQRSNLKKITFLSFFVTSISFFLFSFHVHEKTILVPMLAFMLCSSFKLIRNISKSFYLISLFSLFPLLKRENQEVPYLILLVFVYFFSKLMFNSFENKDKTDNKLGLFSKIVLFLFEKLEYLDILFIICYHVCEIYIAPPARFPWFYPLINSSFAFAHFILYYLVANVKIYLLYKK